MKKAKISKFLFLGMNGMIIISYFFLPIVGIRVPALKVNEAWTALIALTKLIKCLINQMGIENYIVNSILGLPFDKFELSGFTIGISLLGSLGLLIPVIATLIIIFYLIKKDEHQLEYYSFINGMIITILSIIFLTTRSMWIQSFKKIISQLSQEFTYLHITDSMFKNTFPLGLGFYITLITAILTMVLFVFVRFLKPYIDYYIIEKTQRNNLEYFKSKELTGNTGIAGKDIRKNSPLILFENGGKTIRINKIPCTIGRNRNAVDYYLYDESLSRNHCKIDIQHGKALIKDLNSLYGVRINSIRVEPEIYMEFYDEDIVKLGELSFKIKVNWEEIRQRLPEAAKPLVIEQDEVLTTMVPNDLQRIVTSPGSVNNQVPIIVLHPESVEINTEKCFVNKTPYLLGRSKRNVDFSINTSSVSRKHSMIEYLNGHFYISDLGSSNGTSINGIKLQKNEKKEIKFGDKIKLGEVIFTLRN